MGKRIYLCLAHMSGAEQAFIQEAFDRYGGGAFGADSLRGWARG